jgi:uncharacterized protein (TIGR02301 family)
MRRPEGNRLLRLAAALVFYPCCIGGGLAQTQGNVPKQPPAPPAQQAPQQKPAGPEDRPYDAQLLRLSELLGQLHYMRELCGANEGQAWREQMRELVASEGTSALRRAKLVDAFNRGYRDYSRTYRACTPTAITAIQRFMDQAQAIADGLLTASK